MTQVCISAVTVLTEPGKSHKLKEDICIFTEGDSYHEENSNITYSRSRKECSNWRMRRVPDLLPIRLQDLLRRCQSTM